MQPDRLDADDERALAELAGRPDRAEGRRTTSRGRCWRCASTAGSWPGVDVRHPAGRLPGAARAAVLRAGRSGAALPAPRTARRRRRPDSGQLTLDGGAGRVGRCSSRGRDGPGRRRPGPGDALRRGAAERGGARLLAELELPLTYVLADIEAVGIAVDTDLLLDLQSELRRRREGRRAGGARGGRPAVQPGLAQATAGDPVRPARAAQDQADQDRLHDRRRRAGRAVRADEQPAARAAAAAPRGRPAEDGRRFAAAADRRSRAASTRPSTRPSPPPAGCPSSIRTCRTSRCGRPRVAGSGRRSSSAVGLRVR